jgi:hypothetical protein
MSLSYMLHVGVGSTVEQVVTVAGAAYAASGAPGASSQAEAISTGVRLDNGMVWQVLPSGGAMADGLPDPVEESFDVAPSIVVLFTLDTDEEIIPQQDTMVEGCDAVLAASTADAVLHFQYDVVWLLRRTGQLVLNQDSDVWTEPRLALLRPPYQWGSLRFT